MSNVRELQTERERVVKEFPLSLGVQLINTRLTQPLPLSVVCRNNAVILCVKGMNPTKNEVAKKLEIIVVNTDFEFYDAHTSFVGSIMHDSFAWHVFLKRG